MSGHSPVHAEVRLHRRWRRLGPALMGLMLYGCGTVSAQSFHPHPRLADLPDNTALDLGRYDCASRAPGLRCRTIFAYSRINYDPYNHRILAYGGGHAATGRTDVDAFDLSSLTWSSLYPSMSCEEIARGDVDPRGFHRSTGHPVARHTYDQNVIVDMGDRGYLMMFSNAGAPGHCHPYRARARSVAYLALYGDAPRWSYSPEFPLPWGYSYPAEFDPVSGMVILFGGRNPGTLWVYDPGRHEVVASVRGMPRPRNASNLIYFPPTDRMYLINRETLAIHEIRLDRARWSSSSGSELTLSGPRPPPMRNFAYDSRSEIIGGVSAGVFHLFDPRAGAWQAEVISARSPDGNTIGNVAHHAIDYDPVNNVFLLVTDRRSGSRTWAYRYRN